MENTAKPISSIICFNGGTGGDMLLTLCLSQLDSDFNFKLEQQGFLNLKNQYFKETTKKIFCQQLTVSDLDCNKVTPIEHSHYYLDFYTSIAEKIFFIDYKDCMQQSVLERCVEKRYNNDWAQFLMDSKQFLPKFAQDKANEKNCAQLFNIQWKKNLLSWRNNPHMIAINLQEFSNKESMQNIVEKIIGQPLKSAKIFEDIYTDWQEKNKSFLV